MTADQLATRAPVANYAMLRQHHATTLRYTIAKLRWEQANNNYLYREKAWLLHDRVIADMEAELKMVEAAQKAYDHFPFFAYEPFAEPKPKPCGPLTHAALLALEEKEAKALEARNRKLDEQFPFIKQLFIGPMTKQEARNDAMLRDRMEGHCFDDLEILLPPANLELLEKGEAGGRTKEKRKGYWEVRMEREKATIKKMLAEAERDLGEKGGKTEGASKLPRIGPATKEEHMADLPVLGPRTKAEALLVNQREQRKIVINYLQRPWGEYNEEIGDLLEAFGRFAVKQMRKEVGPHGVVEDSAVKPAKADPADKQDAGREQTRSRRLSRSIGKRSGCGVTV